MYQIIDIRQYKRHQDEKSIVVFTKAVPKLCITRKVARVDGVQEYN